MVPTADRRDDRELVGAAQTGDRAALEALLRRHQDRVWRICRRVTGNDADAADATQETMVAVVRRLDRYDGRAAFTTWLYRVATNTSLDELRRRGRRPVPVHEMPEPAAGRRVDDTVADRVDVDAALAQVAPEFRAAVALRDLAGLDYAEIAEILAVPVGTVKSRIARGRAAVAAALGNRSATP